MATLVIAVLTVASSYLRNTEEQAGDVPDTVQWWIDEAASWRIKTFALDHDIHVYAIGPDESGDLREVAIANTRKHYGDVIASQHVLEFPQLLDPESTRTVLADAGLGSDLEVAPAGFAFWNPDGARYHSQSRPKRAV